MRPFASPMLMGGKAGLNVDEVFATTLYTENGGAVYNSLPFAPDMTWGKSRSAAGNNVVTDTLRGTFFLRTNLTDAHQSVGPNTAVINGNGFYSPQYGNSITAVNWSWKQSPRFFQRLTYTGNGVAGRQIAHELAVKPGLIAIKTTTQTGPWQIYHITRSANNLLQFSTSQEFTSNVAAWGSTEPTEEIFTVGGQGGGTNNANVPYIAYLFAHDPDPDGIIRCGHYVGNGSATGPIVPLSWEPQWLLVKSATFANDWIIQDNKRAISNPRNAGLIPNGSAAESSANNYAMNFTSLGFQPFNSSPATNQTSQTYIYMAIRKGEA